MRGNGTKRRIFWHKMNDEKSVREKEIEWRKIRWETVWYLRKVRIWKNISNIPETWKKCWIKHKYSHSLSAHIPAAHFLFLMRMLYVSLCIVWDFFFHEEPLHLYIFHRWFQMAFLSTYFWTHGSTLGSVYCVPLPNTDVQVMKHERWENDREKKKNKKKTTKMVLIPCTKITMLLWCLHF